MKLGKIVICLLIAALLFTGCSASKLRPDAQPSTEPAAMTLPTAQTAKTERENTETEAVSAEGTEAGTEPTSAPAPQTEPAPDGPVENSAFTKIAGDCGAGFLMVICNEPFADGDPEPTVIWNEGEFDRLRICPRWVGSTVSASRVIRNEEGKITGVEVPAYSAVCAGGDCFAAALDRPEGEACWLVSVLAPDGAEAGCLLEYNGRYGSLAYEYLSDPAAFEEYDRLPAAEYTDYMNEVLGTDVLNAFLRAAQAAGIDPWAAMEKYCSPYADLGDGAAYTIWSGEMQDDSYLLQTARIREGYDQPDGSVAERAAAQAELYAEIGNELGILGPGVEAGEALRFELRGLTVYNPTRLAKTVLVIVNGEEIGSFSLSEDDLCTLIDLDLDGLPGDRAVAVEIRVTETRNGDPARAVLEVWPGLNGNISAAR